MKKKKIPLLRITKQRLSVLVTAVVLIVCLVAGYLSREAWLPRAKQVLATVQSRMHDSEGDKDAAHNASEAGDSHAGHDHGDSGEVTSLELSEQGKKNVGLTLVTIKLQDFDRTINIPAMVTHRPGRTELQVSAPMTGIVTRIYPIQGEAIEPGAPLFDLRLTHEDLVDTQTAFLETIEQLDVIQREVDRLQKVTSSGAIAGKRLLERQYEQQQTEARRRAQQQALILHGLTEKQVNEIKTTRRLLQQVTVYAPRPVDSSSGEPDKHLLQVSKIQAAPGHQVQAGDPLCLLGDHAVLYIEGKGFEEDAGELNTAATEGTPITAVIDANGKGPHIVKNLKILYVENEIEQQSRALLFFLRLPNDQVRNEKTADGHQFIGWRFKPGQRVQLLIPIERWKNRIVVPIDAVVQEGVDWFVFQENGNRFDRKPVYVEYRDQRSAVIASDGTLFPGDRIVASGAYQIHLTLKNKAGGGVDPHAGHNH